MHVYLTRNRLLCLADYDDDEPFSHESVTELRQRIRMMRELVEDDEQPAMAKPGKQTARTRRQSIDNGSFLSFTFAFLLFLIIAVGIYAFRNLYLAIVKRYSQ